MSSKPRVIPHNPCSGSHLVMILPALSENISNTSNLSGSIDRLNNCRGYVSDNVVPACYYCNNAKSDLDLKSFDSWVNRLDARRSGAANVK